MRACRNGRMVWWRMKPSLLFLESLEMILFSFSSFPSFSMIECLIRSTAMWATHGRSLPLLLEGPQLDSLVSRRLPPAGDVVRHMPPRERPGTRIDGPRASSITNATRRRRRRRVAASAHFNFASNHATILEGHLAFAYVLHLRLPWNSSLAHISTTVVLLKATSAACTWLRRDVCSPTAGQKPLEARVHFRFSSPLTFSHVSLRPASLINSP